MCRASNGTLSNQQSLGNIIQSSHNVYYVNIDTKHVYVHCVHYEDVVELLRMASQYMHTLSTLHGSSLCWNS